MERLITCLTCTMRDNKRKATSSPGVDDVTTKMPDGGCSLLSDHPNLTAHILSFAVTHTRDLASLRNVSAEWNANVLPLVLKSSAKLKNCSSGDDRFVRRFLATAYALRDADTRTYDSSDEEEEEEENEDPDSPLNRLWQAYQEQNIKEGVAIADGMVPSVLCNNLMNQIDTFSTQHQIVDYHPHSNNKVRDIVHPALYAYVKDVSPTVQSITAFSSSAVTFDQEQKRSSSGESHGKTLDYWGRKYEASAKYQWLPTYFKVGIDGNCTICDYINNLVPRSEHEDLYISLAQLFSCALPLLESVYSYCRVVKQHHLRRHQYDVDHGPGIINEDPISLRGQTLQVITKIVDYELAHGEVYDGVWHVEGMSHEEIVATAIYFIDRDDGISGGNLLFKRPFHRQEVGYIASNIGQIGTHTREVADLIQKGLMPLGRVETKKGRLLCFPNSHVHKVTKLENTNTTRSANDGSKSKQTRRIIVFFLINPEKRIVSTREVPEQQEHVNGSMKRSDALAHRLGLMKERKYAKQDWNVRDIELCEH